MKTHISLLMMLLLCVSCNAQQNEAEKKEKEKENSETVVEQPKGSWKVDKEFDENGNLIRYDSIYSWSSNNDLAHLSSMEKDSILKSFQSKFFQNFSHFENQGFEDVFSSDSLFSKHFFNDDFFGSNFGNDFMDIDKIRQRMLNRQRQFLEKYQSKLITPEEKSN